MRNLKLALLLVLLTRCAPAFGERPNVLIAIADDWSYGHSGAAGCAWVETPAFDRVAREGARFTRAYTPNAKCAPSRACLLTGRNPWRLKAAVNHFPFFPLEFRTYPEALAAAGYAVGYTGKGWAPGVARDAEGERRELAGPRFARRKATPPAEHVSDNDYAANFVDFLEAAGNRPWCFWYGALEPHRRYEYGAGARLAGKRVDQVDRVPAYWPDTEVVRNDLLDYAYEVEHFDRHLGRILDELRRRGALDNTLVVVTSDHGMPFPRCKGQAYEASNHVPLAVRWPAGGVVADGTIDAFVSLVDIAPTLLEAAGVDWRASGMAPADGRSLTRLLRGEVDTHRDHVLIGKERHDVGRPNDAGYPIRGVVERDWLYLRNYEADRWPAGNPETGYLNCDAGATKTLILDRHTTAPPDEHWRLCFGPRPAEELYDLRRDPDCVDNLAETPAYAETKRRLSRRMREELLAEGDPRQIAGETPPDRFRYSDAQRRDYYTKWRRGEAPVAGWVDASDYRSAHNPQLAVPPE